MRFTALLFATAFLLISQADAPPGLATEMDRVRAEASASIPDAQRTAPVARLDRAKAALEAGRPLLALYLFEMPWESAKAFAFVKASSAITTSDAFARTWTALGEPHAAPSAVGQGRRPVVIDAIAAAAEARGAITYYASRPYSEDSGVADGLYYLGESHAVVQFAAFARSLPWTSTAAAPALRSIAVELTALDTEMTTAYETMERSNHSTYIVASAALKQARTLDDRGQYAGALFQYLLSRYIFVPLRGPAAQDATAERIAEARRGLSADVDHSIAELFLQLAEEGIAGTVPAQRRGAAAALEDVIPAYRRAITPATTAAPSTMTAEVTITLVRWPFT